MKRIGLYIHIPFCKSKCPYCDFYSMTSTSEMRDEYTKRICQEINKWGNKINNEADTLYFGGGTPSELGADNLLSIIKTAQNVFNLKDAEITVECNPSSDFSNFFDKLSQIGVNRISLGLQSAIDVERRLLGRKSGIQEVNKVIKSANEADITNISLDLMLGTPGQTLDSVKQSVEYCLQSGAKHISAYILKIEEGTKFYQLKDKIEFPDEDMVSTFYEKTVDLFESFGFGQYEISNFAINGFESKHNLKYWNADEYLGIGVSAHSFIDGTRFYYPSNINDFLNNNLSVISDGKGGNFEEYAMLRLRLKKGLLEKDVLERYGMSIPSKMYAAAKKFDQLGMVRISDDGIALTKKGFLLSNYIIGEII